MIYKSSYKKYIRKENLQNGGLTLIKRLLWVFCVCALTIIAYFVLRFALGGSADAIVPAYMYTTLFGNLYIYVLFTMLLSLVFLLINPSSVSFPELYNNRWYLYTRMGFPPAAMAKTKINSSLWAISSIYGIGYAVIVAFCYIVGIPLVVNFTISLFLVGLVYILFLCLLSMGISVFMKPGVMPRIAILLAFVAVQFLLYSGGFYSYLQPTVFTLRVASLLKFSPTSLLVIFCVVAVLCQIVVALRANSRAVVENAVEFDPNAVNGSWSRSTKADLGDDSARSYAAAARAEYQEQEFTRDQIIPRRQEDEGGDGPYNGYRNAASAGGTKGIGVLVAAVVFFILLTLAYLFASAFVVVPGLLQGSFGQSVVGALGLGEGTVRMIEMLGENLLGKIGVGAGALLLIAVIIVLFVMIKRRRAGE